MTEPQSGWAAPEGPSSEPSSGPSGQAGPSPGSAPRPGVVALRPLGVGEILDGAISYIRANPRVTLGLSALVITATQLVQLPAQYLFLDGLSRLDPAAAPTIDDLADAVGVGAPAALLGGVVNVVALAVLTGLLIVVLSRAVLGRSTSVRQAWTSARPRLPGLLGLILLVTLILAGVFVAGSIPLSITAAMGAPAPVAALSTGILFAAIVLTVYLAVALALAVPAYVLEDVGVLAALSRSRRLVNPAWWRLFGILLLAALLAVLISVIIEIPFGIASAVVDGGLGGDAAVFAPIGLGALLVSAVGSIISGTIVTPFFAGVLGLLYVDQRIRREAWDLELVRGSRDEPPQTGPPSSPA